MTTPKPVALSELPVVARITPDLAETCCEWWWQRHAREVDQDRFTKKLVLHSDALSAIAMHRAEVERLREALETITSMCEMHGEFSNGVTDSTGTIDEGNVRAGEIIGAARAALKETP